MKWYPLIILSVILYHNAAAQDSIQTDLPAGYLDQISKRVVTLSGSIENTSHQAVTALRKSEERLKRKLQRIDSVRAQQVFGDIEEKYSSLRQSLQERGRIAEYIPYLDTLKTTLNFIGKHEGKFASAKSEADRLQKTITKVKSLDESLVSAERVNRFITERKNYLSAQLSTLPLTKQLNKLKKQSYYYRAKMTSYKEAINDSKKRERLAIELLSKTKPFKEFMSKHSELSRLFLMPDANIDLEQTADVKGLQTRASTTALVQSRLGMGLDAQMMFQKTVQDVPRQLSGLKEMALRYAMGSIGNGNDDVDMPNFKPNNQKSKKILKRLEYGVNVQSQTARIFFPVTLDIGLSLGYAVNDRSVIGIGAAYKPGFGSGWKDIKFSSEGIGLRSFVDYQIKGSFFLTGGYERNYWTSFSSIEELKDYSAWQSSGLLGLSKKYSISKKMKGNAQLLWDFLSYYQVPRTRALLFRVGYNFK